MEQTVQKLLQDVQSQLAELENRKKQFEIEMRNQKEQFEQYKQIEIEKMRKTIDSEVKTKEVNLVEREAKIKAQENFVRDAQLKNSKIIKLDVGGKRFKTTLTTLTSDKDSMLAAMFSGRYELVKDEDGYYFIDRNGDLFAFILDFLRTGKVPYGVTENVIVPLKDEATYYQLNGLERVLEEQRTKQKSSTKQTTNHDVFYSDPDCSENWERKTHKMLVESFAQGYNPYLTIRRGDLIVLRQELNE